MKRIIVLISLITMAAALFANGGQETVSGTSDEVLVVEYWNDTSKTDVIDSDFPQNKVLREQFGIELYGPNIAWNGGKDYFQQLQLRIASDEMPDFFLPWNALEYDLADQGAILELSELLPEYAPYIWENISQDTWDIVRANSPDGESIYFLPGTFATQYGQGFLRKDWLDRVGMEVPANLDEYVDVLRAFKAQDANGNGDPDDEIPVTGREYGRWMDHLFMPFDVAMYEGFPQFQVYDGELVYSAVTPNMKAAIAWIRDLYAEGLLDQELFLNKSSIWKSKIHSDLAGSWFHMPMYAHQRLKSIVSVNPDAEVVNLPVMNAPGYEGNYYNKTYRRAEWVFNAESKEKAIKVLQFMDYYTANPEVIFHGVEGYDYNIVDGKEVRIPGDPAKRANFEPKILRDTKYFVTSMGSYKAESDIPFFNVSIDLTESAVGTELDGQGLPPTIWEGYPDIKSNKLYFEMLAKIIIGEWELEMFDEFVEKWYATGGSEVTDAAQAAYARIKGE